MLPTSSDYETGRLKNVEIISEQNLSQPKEKMHISHYINVSFYFIVTGLMIAIIIYLAVMGIDLKKKVDESEESFVKLKNRIANLQTVIVAFKADSVKNSTGSQIKENNFERRVGFLEFYKKDTDTHFEKFNSQMEFIDETLIDFRLLAPIGSILYFPSSSSGIKNINNSQSTWVKCDGRELSKTSYSSLYSVVGNTYGYGSMADNFKIPDLTANILIDGVILIIRIK